MTKLNWRAVDSRVLLRAKFCGGRIDIKNVARNSCSAVFKAVAFNCDDLAVWQSPESHSILTAKYYAEDYFSGYISKSPEPAISAVDEITKENLELQAEIASLANSVEGLEFERAGNRFLLASIRKELGNFANKDGDLVAAIRTLVSSHKRLAEKVDESRKVPSPTSIADIVDRLDKFEDGLKKLGAAVDEIRGAEYR